MTGPTAVPTFDELLADPGKALTLPPSAARTLLIGLAVLQPLLLVQAAKATDPVASPPTEVLIDTKEVAGLIGMSVSWVEKHTEELPVRRSVEGNPRWLKSEILAWITQRPRYGQGV